MSKDLHYKIMILDFKKRQYYREYTRAVGDYVFRETEAQLLYTWLPTDRTAALGYRHSGFLSNPLSRRPFSSFPFITYSLQDEIHGTSWADIGNFDLQPHIQD